MSCVPQRHPKESITYYIVLLSIHCIVQNHILGAFMIQPHLTEGAFYYVPAIQLLLIGDDGK